VSRPRKPTATSSFGVGRREAHDASDFYARFTAPEISDAAEVEPYGIVDEIYCLDAREMDTGHERLKSDSVALVVTSPPYFAGKDYEVELGTGHVPGSYLEYLEMLHDVFAACVAKLEPGGRIAVNVANLGRKPYRSLSADVIAILQDRLGLLLRGEVIWRKGRGTSGSCAWGTFQNAGNPVLRDLTERVVIASKGRFDRAVPVVERARRDLPHASTVSKDEYMEATLDVWELPSESASRVGHPAPFPVELPQRLIELYTYAGDLIVDPFMGSGSTAIAAVRTGRHFVGFDTDSDYVQAAKARVEHEREVGAARAHQPIRVPRPKRTAGDAADAIAIGEQTRELVALLLVESGFADVEEAKRPVHDVDVSLTATDARGTECCIEVVGARTTGAIGLRSVEAIWRVVGKAAALRAAAPGTRFLVFSPELPPRGSRPAKVLARVGDLLTAVLDPYDPATPEVLRAWARQDG
jgi:site-specific DNA-methyltransferase (adenine-specific)